MLTHTEFHTAQCCLQQFTFLNKSWLECII